MYTHSNVYAINYYLATKSITKHHTFSLCRSIFIGKKALSNFNVFFSYSVNIMSVQHHFYDIFCCIQSKHTFFLHKCSHVDG
jgi:hypothetical protein